LGGQPDFRIAPTYFAVYCNKCPRRQKQFGGEQNFLEYFFTHPNMTDLVGKYHIQIA